MKKTIKITVEQFQEWWVEIGKRGHKIVVMFGVIILIGFALLLYAAVDGVYAKIYYRTLIEQNTHEIEELKKKK